MTKLILSLAFLLSLASVIGGCGAGDVFHGDVTFTLEERHSIEHANLWLAATLEEAPFEIVWDLPHPVDGVEVDISVASIRRGRAPSQASNVEGWTQGERAVSIRVSADHQRLETVTAHELGHCRGLKHHNGPGLMNPHGESKLEWTIWDEERRVNQ